MAKTSQTIRVFVSSTFRDMHAERDYLNRFVFPELRSRCLKRGMDFVGVDLRWGVTEEEAQQRGNLAICLEEIERCRPFFVCLLGDRFGWVPPPEEIQPEFFMNVHDKEKLVSGDGIRLDDWYRLDETTIPPVYRLRRDKKIPDNVTDALVRFWEATNLPLSGESITTREILRAAFEEGYPQSHPLFYLRKSGLHRHPDFPRPFVQIFEEQNPSRVAKLNNLKRRIQGRVGEIVVREYDAKYDGLRIDPTFLPSNLSATEREALKDGVIRPEEWESLSDSVQSAMEVHGTVALTGMEELGQQILEDLWAVIESELEKHREIISVYTQDRAYHERFIVDRTRLFFGREELLKQMLTYVSDTKDRHPLVITGQPGCGKSALMAECARQCRERFSDTLVLPHFIGAAPGSTDLTATIRSLCETLRRECALRDELSEDPKKLRFQLTIFLEKAGAKRPVILLLDAINQLNPVDRSHGLNWFPFPVPVGVRVIVSTLAGDCLDRLRDRVPANHFLEVSSLPGNDRRKLVHEHLALRRKKLDDNQLARLLNTDKSPDADLPLYLLVALEELCLFGDYDALNQRIDRLPSTLPELFTQVLGRLEHDHGREITESICCWLAVSRLGLFESEIIELLGDTVNFSRVHWTRFYRALEFYLRPMDETTGAGMLDFFHDQLRFAVCRRYFNMTTPEAEPTDVHRNAHRQLATYFRSIACDEGDLQKWHTDRPRGLSELPFHQIQGAMWPELEKTLCDLYFIEAKCASGMTYELVRDYSIAFDILPEAQDEKQHEQNERIARYLQELIGYAKSWSDALESHSSSPDCNSLPELDDIPIPNPPPSIKVCTDEDIKSDTYKIINNPTRLDRIRAFHNFVDAESHNLSKHAQLSGYVIQHAHNQMSDGPVGDAAYRETFAQNFGPCMLLLRKTYRPHYNPHSDLLRTMGGHSDVVNTLAITPDGQKAVSGSADKTIRVWDIETGNCLQTLQGHLDSVTAVAVTVDGRRIVSGSADKTLRIWDTESGQCLQEISGFGAQILSIALTPGGERVAPIDGYSPGFSYPLHIYETRTNKCIRIIKDPGTVIHRVALTLDGRFAICSVKGPSSKVFDKFYNNWLRIWAIESGECVQTIHGHWGNTRGLALTADGKKLIVASSDRKVRIWDIKSGQCVKMFKHQWSVIALSVTADSRLIVSACTDQMLYVWDVESGKCLKTIKIQPVYCSISTVVLTADGKLAVSCGGDETLQVWDIERGHSKAEPMNQPHAIPSTQVRYAGSQIVSSLNVSANGKQIISLGGALWWGTMCLWDAESGLPVKSIGRNFVTAICLTNDKQNAILISGGLVRRNRFSVWNIKNRRFLYRRRFETRIHFNTVALTPDDRLMITGGNISMFNQASNLLRDIKGSANSTSDYALHVRDIENGRCLRTLQSTEVKAAVITPDGNLIAAGTSSEIISIWDIKNDRYVKRLKGHSGDVNTLVATPDGRFLVSGSDDASLRIWDIRSGQCVRVIEDHTSGVTTLLVTQDNRWIISGSNDRTIRVYDINNGQCIIVSPQPAPTTALTINNNSLVAGNMSGYLAFMNFLNINFKVVIVTAVRMWRFGVMRWWQRIPKIKPKGSWDEQITSVCGWCGISIVPSAKVLDAISGITKNASLSFDRSPCISLPMEAWDEPRLLSKCPNCNGKLKFNPFIVDNRDRY